MQLWDERMVQLAVLASLVCIVLLAVWNIVLSVRQKKLRAMLQRWAGESSLSDFDQAVAHIREQLADNQAAIRRYDEILKEIAKAIKLMKAHAGLVRYNAFGDRGSDLSFSLAIVDQERNGFVLSAIRNRDTTYMYVKPLRQGDSDYALTPEEREAIDQALRKQPPLAQRRQ